MEIFGLGPMEILLVVIVILIVFGPAKVPEITRTIGKTMNTLKKSTSDFTAQMNKEFEEVEKQANVKDDPKPAAPVIPATASSVTAPAPLIPGRVNETSEQK